MMVLWMVVLLTITSLLYLLDRRKKNVLAELPGPGTLPFIGNAHQCVGTSSDFFQIVNQAWHEFGSRMRVFIGSRILLLLSDPKDVEVVLSSMEFIDKSEEYYFLTPWLGRGLLTGTGERWRAHRKMITPAFHFKILENFMEVFLQQTETLIELLRTKVDKEPIDLYPIIGRYALDIISETAMGVSINAQKHQNLDYVRAVQDMCEVMYRRTKNPFKRIDFLFKFTRDYRMQTRALKILHGFTNKMIHERRKILQEKQETLESYTTQQDDGFGRKKKMAFLDLLLLSQVNGVQFSDEELKEEVDTFLFEGHDTTTSALSFALNQISKNPDVQQKLYEEQMMIFGDDPKRKTTYADLQDMKYLDMTIKEAVRLFPTAPLMARETSHDTKINDLYVPKGTSIVLMVFNMNRNPEIFPEPDKFIPERYSLEESSKRSPFASPSFSAGPRNCIGQKFAMMEMKHSISKILREFELLPSPENLELKCDVILKSHNGVYIRLTNRKPKAG